jgi:DNA-binding CsgD family transcriptional regulator
MASSTYECEKLLADLAQRRRQFAALRREYDDLKAKLQIAETPVVSENAVKTHIESILTKLSLKNRTQAAAYALLETQAY